MFTLVLSIEFVSVFLFKSFYFHMDKYPFPIFNLG